VPTMFADPMSLQQGSLQPVPWSLQIPSHHRFPYCSSWRREERGSKHVLISGQESETRRRSPERRRRLREERVVMGSSRC